MDSFCMGIALILLICDSLAEFFDPKNAGHN
jgi:hypothetical protein